MTIAIANCANCATMRNLVPEGVMPQPLRPDLGTGAVKGRGSDPVKGMGSDLGAGAVKRRAGDSNVAASAAMFEPFRLERRSVPRTGHIRIWHTASAGSQ